MSETGVTFNVTALNQLSVLQTLNTSLNAKMIDLSGKMQAVSDKMQDMGRKITSELNSVKDAVKEVTSVLQKGFSILVASGIRSTDAKTKSYGKIKDRSLLNPETEDESGVSKLISDVTSAVMSMLQPLSSAATSRGSSSLGGGTELPAKDVFGVGSAQKEMDFWQEGMKDPFEFTGSDILTTTIEALQTKSQTWLKGMVNPFEKLAKIGPAMGKAFKEIGTQFGGMIKASLFMQPLMSALGALLAPFEPITEIVTSFGEILGMAFLPIVQALVPALTNLLPGFFAISNALSGPIQEAVNYLTPVLEKFWGVLEQVWAILEPVLAQLWEAMQPVFDMIGQLITEGFDWLGEIMIELAPVIAQIVEVFIALMPVIMPIIEIILRINMLITQLVTGVIVSVITKIVDIISKSEALKNIFDSVVNGIAKFLESIQKLLGWLMGAEGKGERSWWNFAG
jgi:phage-related protein